MRVTDSMLYSQSIYNMDQAQSNVQTLTDESSTGVAVTTPWDNPGAASLAVGYEVAGARLGAISQATTQAAAELSSADSALGSITTSIQQAVQLAQEMGSGVHSAGQTAAQVQAVTNIQGQIVAALNTQVGNRYIFGGSVDNAPPFSAAGVYSGDSEVRQVEIAPGVLQNASVNVNDAVNGAAGGVNVFTALAALSTALSANNSAAIMASEADLNTAFAQVSDLHTTEGTTAATLQVATQVSQTAQLGQTSALSTTVDADEVTAASQLAQAQTVLQAAISASSKSFELSMSTLQQQGV